MSSENLKKVLFFLFFPLFTLEKSKIFNFFSLLQRFLVNLKLQTIKVYNVVFCRFMSLKTHLFKKKILIHLH